MKHICIALMLGLLGGGCLSAQAQGVLGTWTEPTGSSIEIYHCGSELCARLVGISPQAASKFDIHNPDTKMRSVPLCGLVVARGFHLDTANKADGGQLYDPKSGNTYSGAMTSDGDRLVLRGYVGFKIFGRTETWTRAKQGARHCDKP